MGKKTAEKKSAKVASVAMTDTGGPKSKGKGKHKNHDGDAAKSSPGLPGAAAPVGKISNKEYAREMKKLDVKLVKLQQWVVQKGLKVCIVRRPVAGAVALCPRSA